MMSFHLAQIKCFIEELIDHIERKKGCLYPSTFSFTGLSLDKFEACNITGLGTDDDDFDQFNAFVESMMNPETIEIGRRNCNRKLENYSKNFLSYCN